MSSMIFCGVQPQNMFTQPE